MDIESWGVHGPIMLAGLAGGLCYVLRPRPITLREASGNLVTATLTSNYCYELGSHYLGAGYGLFFAAFATGLAAPLLINWLLLKAGKLGVNGNGNGIKEPK